MHGRQRAAHRVDQVVVNGGRHLGPVERRVQRGGIFARVGKEQQLLHLRGQRRRCGIAELAVHRIQRIECGPAQRAVIGLHQRDKGAVRDRMPVPILIGRVRKEIGVIEHGVDIVRTGRHLARSREQRLLLV